MWPFSRKKKKQKEEKQCCAQAKEQKSNEAKEEVKPENSAKEQKAEPTKQSTKQTAEKQTEKETTEEKSRKALYRVMFDKDKKVWVIKKDGAKRVIATYATKDEAVARVQQLSQSGETGFVVHKKDGKFQKKKNLNISSGDKTDK